MDNRVIFWVQNEQLGDKIGELVINGEPDAVTELLNGFNAGNLGAVFIVEFGNGGGVGKDIDVKVAVLEQGRGSWLTVVGAVEQRLVLRHKVLDGVDKDGFPIALGLDPKDSIGNRTDRKGAGKAGMGPEGTAVVREDDPAETESDSRNGGRSEVGVGHDVHWGFVRHETVSKAN